VGKKKFTGFTALVSVFLTSKGEGFLDARSVVWLQVAVNVVEKTFAIIG
jgi:hypothetical protein